jgi:hypothetical protein
LFGDTTKGGRSSTTALLHEIMEDTDAPVIAPVIVQSLPNDEVVHRSDAIVSTDPNPPSTIFHKVYDLHDDMERKIYTDQTGKCPFKLYRGMQYIMVLYEMDSNGILVEGMRDRTSGEMVAAY